MYEADTIYVIGHAKVQQQNPIMKQFGQFYIAFVVQKPSGIIVDCEASFTLNISERMIKSIFCGKSMATDGEILCNEIETRYFGSSQKSILVAFREAQKRWEEVTG